MCRWVLTLKFYNVWIGAIFKNIPVWAGTVLCALFVCPLLQLSLQLLHLQMEADHRCKTTGLLLRSDRGSTSSDVL